VTRETFEPSLASAGFAAADAASRAVMFAAAAARLASDTERPARWAWFVPGRIEVFGKHTDYAGGRSLVAAVPRGFAFVAAPRDDGRLRVIDARWGDEVELDPADRSLRYRGWKNYVAVVARRLARNFPGAPLGLDAAFVSDLPRAAGVSSSSALVVGLGTALVRRGGLEARPEWAAAIGSRLDLAGYFGAVENGLTFASLPGTSGVGTHGGSEDHTAILTGRADHVRAFRYLPVRHLGDARMPDSWRFIVMASGIQADKAGSAREHYNRASLTTRALLGAWNTVTGEAHATLGDVLVSRPGAAGDLARLVGQGGHGGYSASDLSARLAHFLAEDARVMDALGAFAAADAAALGRLARDSQSDADTLLGNQIPETRALAELALESGAFAASSFGAGFGGSVWAVAPAHQANTVRDRWRAAYLRHHPGVAEIDSFVTRPASGVAELQIAE
jgi:galactokinase